MQYSFINIHTKAKVVQETDKYLIKRRVKSTLSYADNYLEIKIPPKTEEDINYYVEVCKKYFKEKGINFVHLGLQEGISLDKKLLKYMKKENYSKIDLALYVLDTNEMSDLEDSEYEVSELDKKTYTTYLDYNYKLDLEMANKEWAEHNKESIYEDIRTDYIKQIIAKDGDKIIGSVNIILDDDYFEIDNLYVLEGYRRRGVATHLIKFAIDNFKKNNVILVADAEDTPRRMYEKIGFEVASTKMYFLKSDRKINKR